MRQEDPGRGGPLGPLAALHKTIPFEAAAASHRLGWLGLEAALYRAAPASELNPPAIVAGLSPYHFAWQFKMATGLPPHWYIIARRVERAKELLQAGTDVSLVEVAAHAGFSDQSQFCQHFKRIVGVTPGQFRTLARTA
jgi:transcriptional regulator GlxA family with amidase domain